jgi:hypothetical protein
VEERERDRSEGDRSFAGLRERGSNGGIASLVAGELAGGERVSAGGRERERLNSDIGYFLICEILG